MTPKPEGLQRDPIDVAGGHPNVYLYCDSDPVNWFDNGGLDSVYKRGHHVVPVSLWEGKVSPEAARVFANALTGTDPGHCYDAAHRRYNRAVRKLFQNWLKKHKIDPAKMTRDEALRFVNAVLSSTNNDIKGFLQQIANRQGIKDLKTLRKNVFRSIQTNSQSLARVNAYVARNAPRTAGSSVVRGSASLAVRSASRVGGIGLTIGIEAIIFLYDVYRHGFDEACSRFHRSILLPTAVPPDQVPFVYGW